ncbi:MAG: radical SAM protein [Bacteroidales bacterium 45-6]|nr:MAG: radical SAM protein [Bacteroidales bacterium 45-6]
MATILFNEIIFGPIHSRRLGVSLGINLLPTNGKRCSFDCIYCECGYNKDFKTDAPLPSQEAVREALEKKLLKLEKQQITPDVITFAGNGEPTMHPQFAEIIDDTLALRDKFFPSAKISVLSNAAHIGKKKIFDALLKVDNNILKLDAGKLETIQLMDRPLPKDYTVEKQIALLKKFDGNFILQTMFLRGKHAGKVIDNSTEEEVSAWLEAVKEIQPKEVMVYSIDRETPEKQLEKVTLEELEAIGKRVEKLGIKVNIAG